MQVITASLFAAQTGPFISDQLGRELIQAGSTIVVLFVMALGLWVLIRPLVNGFISRNRSIDATTQAFIDEGRAAREEARAARDDNRKLIKVIEDGREDDRKQTEAIQALTSAIQQQTATTAKLIDVAMGQIQTAQQEAQKLPALLQAQRDTSVEQVRQAVTQAFELRDEKFERILKRLDELDHKFDANEAVTEEMKALLNEVLALLKTAQPVERKDTGPLPPLPDTPPDARKEAPAPTGTPHSSIDKPEEG